MIIFKKLTMTNFMAIGKPVIINLNNKKLTLIYGKNGAGKTTIIYGLIYALYGETYSSDITLLGLVNKQNKNMSVSLEIENQHSYKILRGNNILEVWKNGIKLDKFSSKKLINKYILENIICQDKETFLQLCIWGVNYEPILDLSKNKRREFIEKIFNIDILTKMKDLVKELNKKTLNQKNDIKDNINTKELEIKHNIKLKQQQEENVKVNIKLIENDNLELIEKIDSREFKYKALNYDKNTFDKLNKQIKDKKNSERSLNVVLWGLESTFKVNQRELSNLTKQTDICSSCGQKLPLGFNEKGKEYITETIEEKRAKIEKLKLEIKIESEDLDKLNKEFELIKKQKVIKENILTELRIYNSNLNNNKNKIEKFKKKIIIDNLEELTKELEDLKREYMVVLERVNYLKYFKDDFLSDSGYKYYLLSKFFPQLKTMINKCLSEYGLDLHVDIDKDFNFKIFDRKSEIKYPLSNGQKFRVNLSIWEASVLISRHNKNIETNLLMFDEILDGPLDEEGQEIFLQTLGEKIEKYNKTGFIISHSMTNFENKIEVTINNGFSSYEFK